MLSLLQTKLQDPKPRLILRDHPMAKARACEKKCFPPNVKNFVTQIFGIYT